MNNDKNTYFDRFTDEVLPKYLASQITDEECENLQDNKGLDGSTTNCEVFNEELIPMLQQEVDNILHDVKNIYANEDSKCSQNDENPTHASMLSRILRFSQAVTCILCSYDPVLVNLLKQGTYPQVLMGTTGGKYPQWKTPDTVPTEDSRLPITSGGVYTAIQNALLSVWHIWADHDTFSYYLASHTELSNITDAEEGDTAIIKDGEDGINQLYSYEDNEWVAGDVLGIDEPANFSITKIQKGYYAGKEIYYMKTADGTPTWNLLDATLVELENRVTALEELHQDAVYSANDDQYLFGVADTLSDAQAMPATTGKTTITLIMGD